MASPYFCWTLHATKNKQTFVNILSGQLKNNCQVYHSQGDADLPIMQKAVESSITKNTVLIGDDTDLLILLIYNVNNE